MKNTFGLWPKFALLLIVAAFTFSKFPSASVHENEQQKPAIAYQMPSTAPALPVVYSQVESPVDTLDVGDPSGSGTTSGGGLWSLIKQNWALVVTAFLGLIEVIVRLTPTERDNSIFNFIKYILDKIIPNQRTGSGVHE